MIDLNVPPNFQSDGCTMPKWLKPIMSAGRYVKACRRHDFECRYSIYPWWSANWYLVCNIWRIAPWYLKWQAVFYFLGVTWNWRRCKYTVAKLPDPWRKYIHRRVIGKR